MGVSEPYKETRWDPCGSTEAGRGLWRENSEKGTRVESGPVLENPPRLIPFPAVSAVSVLRLPSSSAQADSLFSFSGALAADHLSG